MSHEGGQIGIQPFGGLSVSLGIDLAFLASWEGRHEDALQFAGVSDSL